MKLTHNLIKSVAKDIESGMNNKEACHVNNIAQKTLYEWIKVADRVKKSDSAELTKHEKLCVKFVNALETAKIHRKQKRIKALDTAKSVAGIIFLLKNEYPDEFNKQPHPIPNFAKLEEFMKEEYPQEYFEAIQKAILAAEDWRQGQITYDEDDLFNTNDSGNNEDPETSEV